MFQYENEARLVMQALKARLGKFGLELAEDKTRILPIGRFKGTKEDFDFLGFTFFNTLDAHGQIPAGRAHEQEAGSQERSGKPVRNAYDALADLQRLRGAPELQVHP